MTQVVAAGNWSYAVVVADRRFTVDGQLVDEADDERNKLLIVATPTTRLAVAFCGLARLRISFENTSIQTGPEGQRRGRSPANLAGRWD
jgi:hypothetical protein